MVDGAVHGHRLNRSASLSRADLVLVVQQHDRRWEKQKHSTHDQTYCIQYSSLSKFMYDVAAAALTSLIYLAKRSSGR
ncbi:uncharacterized protein PHALS_14589 [Plasmopara halstedii]|uniref:Uncharacterized protein n=1 Tax=Plasmopara halstedii TaxID=4781 RepID=A0A0P1AL18_PLAHL|nr:uncharacterized protein PHALS_14589 [Plasmopara halstedii]CEG42093.1 hypothetical protein PHALS_14589 [Plasmopara halstedii]|eukprot:XP_024578462.1 hypothetical protein PHALS_14589 [Plasmopara halstedii]